LSSSLNTHFFLSSILYSLCTQHHIPMQRASHRLTVISI
jgi:hypothetical protein